ncbi:MAG: heme o synthase, partial [Bdellovibrionaceae bacterium]|nr:heme o synthase [Pseudobdellovibrionaceae bacterium]
MLKQILKDYYTLSKMGIVIFALFTSGLSYILALPNFSYFSLSLLLAFCFAFYFVCSGSFILNQVQEWSWDKKMDRTKNRPIPRGKMSPTTAYILATLFLLFGLGVLFLINPITSFLAFITVVLYNLFYTLFWKRHLKYGAVLGAIPGAMPPVIGYSLASNDIFQASAIYLFLLLFFWQMPHFWSLAIQYKKDYKKAGFPTLPVIAGTQKTLYQIGLYTLAYLGLALISPLFLTTGFMYLFLLVPFAFILLYQFYQYFYKLDRWLKFFLWINASILVYFFVPVLDKWIFHSVIR